MNEEQRTNMFNQIANAALNTTASVMDASQIEEDQPVIQNMGGPTQRNVGGSNVIHKNPPPILIACGDISGNGREYRYPLGPGMNCDMKLGDGITPCEAQAYWYCDQTMTCCGMVTLFKGCGKKMCDKHCKKQYGDQYN
jgi:hypothetical protein